MTCRRVAYWCPWPSGCSSVTPWPPGSLPARSVFGRGYSIATLLRTRHGFTGQLRAVGDVLRDQLFLMKRCGFNAFLIRADRSAADALAGLRDFSEPYQGAVDVSEPLWRRHARS
ncbi:MAG: DUF934 domain-containing protein [Betaproteobacteria bacterium]|nr:DUF934 domain-containing protein [Betaproteobacteria bacterium]